MAFTQEQRDQIVSDIVANGAFTEDSRDHLENLTDNQLVALINPEELDDIVNNMKSKKKAPPFGKKMEDEEDDEDEMEMNGKDKKKMKGTYNSAMSYEDWMDSAPPEIQRIVLNAQQMEENRREQLISQITANGACPLGADVLAERSTEDLEVFAQMTRPNSVSRANFMGAAGGPITNNAGKKVEPLGLPGADYMTPPQS